MQFVTFTSSMAPPSGGEAPRLGVITGETVRDLAAIDPTLPRDMLGLIEAGPEVLAVVRSMVAAADTAGMPLSQVRLLAPMLRTPKGIIGIGLNYRAHVDESARTMQTPQEMPTHPVIFIKPDTAIIGPDAAIVKPAATQMLDYEAELGVIIGRGGRNIAQADALAHVFGYTIINDVSARDMRHGGQWCFSKGQDSFCPMGPCIVTADEIADPHDLDVWCAVSGEVRQNSNTRHMIFNIPQLIAHISSGMTLQAGDVIATGTPEGVGISYTPPRFMQPGDWVEMRVQGIGTLRNPVVA